MCGLMNKHEKIGTIFKISESGCSTTVSVGYFVGGYGYSITITCNPKNKLSLGDFVTVLYEDSYLCGCYKPCNVSVIF